MPACRHFLMWVFKILVLTLLEETNKWLSLTYLIYRTFDMADIINFYKKPSNDAVIIFLHFFHFFSTFWNLFVLICVVSCLFHSVARHFVIKIIKNYQKKPNRKLNCQIESGNIFLKERSNQPWAMLGTWRTKSSRLDFCWLLRYLVNAHVYSSNE